MRPIEAVVDGYAGTPSAAPRPSAVRHPPDRRTIPALGMGACFRSRATTLTALPNMTMMSCLVIGVVTCVAALRPSSGSFFFLSEHADAEL